MPPKLYHIVPHDLSQFCNHVCIHESDQDHEYDRECDHDRDRDPDHEYDRERDIL